MAHNMSDAAFISVCLSHETLLLYYNNGGPSIAYYYDNPTYRAYYVWLLS